MEEKLFSGCTLEYWIDQIKELTCRIEDLEAKTEGIDGTTIQAFGNSGHIILPKSTVGKRIFYKILD
jgi:putative transposon-encoded protein